MLVLGLHSNTKIVIKHMGETMTIEIPSSCNYKQTKLAFDAPMSFDIGRDEEDKTLEDILSLDNRGNR